MIDSDSDSSNSDQQYQIQYDYKHGSHLSVTTGTAYRRYNGTGVVTDKGYRQTDGTGGSYQQNTSHSSHFPVNNNLHSQDVDEEIWRYVSLVAVCR